MVNNKKKSKGFTIVEMMMAIIITSVMLLLINAVFRFSIFSFSQSEKELQYQSEMRFSMANMKSSIEKTRAVFLMNNNDFYDSSKTPKPLKPKWDYYALSADKKQFLLYRYDPNKTPVAGEPAYLAHHNVLVMANLEGEELALSFEKQVVLTEDEEKGNAVNSAGGKLTKDEATQKQLENSQNHFVKMNLATLGKNGTVLRELNTAVEAKSSITVANAKDLQDLVNNPITVMAVRSTEFDSEAVVFISLILDVSGSMRRNIDGSEDPTNTAAYNARNFVARFDMLKDTLNGRSAGHDRAGNWVDAKTGFLESMSGYGAFYVRLVPYGDTANYPEVNYYSGSNEEEHPFLNLGVRSQLEDAKDVIEHLDKIKHRYGSATNTGDGIRRAYYYHESFRDDIKAEFEQIYKTKKGVSTLTPAMQQEFEKRFNKINIKEYTIILTDGNSNSITTDQIVEDNLDGSASSDQSVYAKFKTDDGPVKSVTDRARKTGTNYYSSDPAPYHYYCIVGPFKYADGRPVPRNTNSIAEEYAEQMGAKMKNRNVDTYVIGFSNVDSERNSAQKLAKSMNGELFEYNDNFNLDDIFDEIANRIDADIAILKGPY